MGSVFLIIFDLVVLLIVFKITWMGYQAIKNKKIKTNFGKSEIEGELAVKRGKFFFYLGLFILIIFAIQFLIALF